MWPVKIPSSLRKAKRSPATPYCPDSRCRSRTSSPKESTRNKDGPMTAAATKAKKYDEQSIRVLKDLEPVRVRPAMYIGATDKRGLHHLIWEIVDNAVDEYINGHADAITVTLHKGGDSVTITDNG